MSSPAAWHPDPTGRHDHRYWDGERWTEHVADAGVASTDPLDHLDTDRAVGGDEGGTDMPPIEPSVERPSEPTAGTPSAPAAWQAPAAPTGPPAYGAGGFPAAAPIGEPAPAGSNGAAILAMVFGIAAILFSWIGVITRTGGIVLLLVAVAAIVLGVMGKRRANRGAKGNGMAITGLVTGIIGVLAAGLFLVGGEFYRAFSDDFNEFIRCVEETGDEERCQEELERRILERARR